MNPAYLVAALGSVLYGTADFLGGRATRSGDAWSVTFLASLSALAVLVIGLPFLPGVPRPADLAWAAAAGAFGAIGAMLIYRAIAIGPVSVASPVLCVVGLSIPVVVGIGLGERPGTIALVGLALAPVSIVLLAQSGSGATSPDGRSARRVLWPAIAAGLVAGAFLVCFGQIRSGSGLWPLLLARGVSIALLAATLAARRAAFAPPLAARGGALWAGALDSLANVAYVEAVQRGSLSLAATLVSLGPASTVLLARALLGERWSVPQRYGLLAALIAGACVSSG